MHVSAQPLPKRSANLSINANLLKEARELHLNLSKMLEEKLIEVVNEARKKKWLEENKLGIEEYNKHIEKNGLFSDDIRKF